MELPLKMKVLQLDDVSTGRGEPQVECFYTIVDAKDVVVLPRNHFVCKQREFDVVAKYTLERLTARYASATPAVDVVSDNPTIMARIAAARAQAAPVPPAPAPTPLDQTISPPGPVRKVTVK